MPLGCATHSISTQFYWGNLISYLAYTKLVASTSRQVSVPFLAALEQFNDSGRMKAPVALGGTGTKSLDSIYDSRLFLRCPSPELPHRKQLEFRSPIKLHGQVSALSFLDRAGSIEKIARKMDPLGRIYISDAGWHGVMNLPTSIKRSMLIPFIPGVHTKFSALNYFNKIF